MRNKLYILFWVVIFFYGCGIQKSHTPPTALETLPTWNTCVIRNARAEVHITREGNTNAEQLSATITMQTVHDSLLIISVMPMLGIEMLRVEATPTEVICIDKIHGQYTRATYEIFDKYITPTLNWNILQQTCAAELPTGNEKARLQYHFKKHTIELNITYPERQLNTPLRIQRQPLHKYKQIDITQWL